MATVDQANNFKIVQSLAPDFYNTTPACTAVDTSGYEAVTIELSIGDYVDMSFGFYLQTSTTNGGYTAILPATDFLDGQTLFPLNPQTGAGAQTFFPYSTSNTDYTVTAANHATWANKTWWIGYAGSFEWVQPVVIRTAAGGMTGMAFGINVILGWPHTAPTRLVDPNQVG